MAGVFSCENPMNNNNANTNTPQRPIRPSPALLGVGGAMSPPPKVSPSTATAAALGLGGGLGGGTGAGTGPGTNMGTGTDFLSPGRKTLRPTPTFRPSPFPSHAATTVAGARVKHFSSPDARRQHPPTHSPSTAHTQTPTKPALVRYPGKPYCARALIRRTLNTVMLSFQSYCCSTLFCLQVLAHTSHYTIHHFFCATTSDNFLRLLPHSLFSRWVCDKSHLRTLGYRDGSLPRPEPARPLKR
jgi:hypothetical protein